MVPSAIKHVPVNDMVMHSYKWVNSSKLSFSIEPDHFAGKSPSFLANSLKLIGFWLSFLFSIGKSLWHPVCLRASRKYCRLILYRISVKKDQSSSSGSSLRAKQEVEWKIKKRKKANSFSIFVLQKAEIRRILKQLTMQHLIYIIFVLYCLFHLILHLSLICYFLNVFFWVNLFIADKIDLMLMKIVSLNRFYKLRKQLLVSFCVILIKYN